MLRLTPNSRRRCFASVVSGSGIRSAMAEGCFLIEVSELIEAKDLVQGEADRVICLGASNGRAAVRR